MEKEYKEEILNKLYRFLRSNVIVLKKSEEEQGISIYDVKYCGKISFEDKNGKESIPRQEDVYEVIKIDRQGRKIREYYTQDDRIAIDLENGLGILPSGKEREDMNIKPFEEVGEQKKQSFNELAEQERLKQELHYSDDDIKDMTKNGELDQRKEFENRTKGISFKADTRITANETFKQMNSNPEAKTYEKVGFDEEYNPIALDKEGKIQEVKGVQQRDGKNPNASVATVKKDGTVVNKVTNSVLTFEGREDEGIAFDKGGLGDIGDVTYVRGMKKDTMVGVEVRTSKDDPIPTKLQRGMDKTIDPDITDNYTRAMREFKQHDEKTVYENIDDDLSNNKEELGTEIKEDGTHIRIEQVYEQLYQELKITTEKGKEEVRKSYDSQKKHLTVEQKKENVELELDPYQQDRGNRNQ